MLFKHAPYPDRFSGLFKPLRTETMKTNFNLFCRMALLALLVLGMTASLLETQLTEHRRLARRALTASYGYGNPSQPYLATAHR